MLWVAAHFVVLNNPLAVVNFLFTEIILSKEEVTEQLSGNSCRVANLKEAFPNDNHNIISNKFHL